MKCRLCSGGLTKKFSAIVLKNHEVNYWECDDCGSLQTDVPFWLDEAYSDGNLTYLDVGAVQRNINNFSIISAIAKLTGSSNILDYGGGDGLLCRNLRDIGLNAYVSDKYASLSYAKGFGVPDFSLPELSVAFEVVEHFPDPAHDFEDLFSRRPKFLLISTVLYRGQDEEWWYLSKETGQHIFFYTKKAMEVLARKYGYEFMCVSDYIFFYNDVGPLKRKLIKKILSNKWRRLVRLWAVDIPVVGLDRDYQFLIKNFTHENNSGK